MPAAVRTRFHPKVVRNYRVLRADFLAGAMPAGITVARAGNTATRVNSLGKIETVNANIGRLDYSPLTLGPRGLLVEEARTQLLGTTEALGSLTATALTITANTTDAPTGATTADKAVPTSANSQHRVDHAAVTADGTSTYTLSTFAKISGTTNYPLVRLRYFDTNSAYLDITTDTVGSTGGSGTAGSVRAVGNDWRRCSMTSVPTAAAHTPRINLADDGEVTTFIGDAANGHVLWGWQLEVGKFPSSYIANSGAAGTTVARAADDCSMAGSALPGFNGGTVSISVHARTGYVTSQQQQCFYALYVDANNYIQLIRDTSQHIRWQVVTAGATVADLDVGTIAADTEFHTALMLKSDSARACLDGAQTIVSDASVTVPASLSSGTVYFGRNGAGSEYANGWLCSVMMWQGELSDPELRTETSSPPISPPGPLVAFPGALGFGRFSKGGRGGTVIHVTNLNDSGAGSLRTALTTSGARHVVFDVSGTIVLSSAIAVTNPFVTLAGETAPAPGIQIKGFEVSVQTHDVIVRHITFSGDEGAGTRDSFNIRGTATNPAYNVIVDHCTMRWAGDGCLDVVGSPGQITAAPDYVHDITVQSCLVGQSLATSSGNTLVDEGPYNVTFYRTVWHNGIGRHPRVHSWTKVEVVNCLSYNCSDVDLNVGDSGATAPEPCEAVVINSRYVAGPNTNTSNGLIHWLSGVWATGSKLFHSGVTQTGARTVFTNNSGMNPIQGTPPYSSGITAVTADASFETSVLAGAGARPNARDSATTSAISGIAARTMAHGNLASYGGPVSYANNTSVYVPPANPNNDNDADGWTNIEEDFHLRHAALL